ncbi:MAG TPA: hypothetical protein VJO35_02605 [Terriglobales bacterium]|nr:hypothetical protein [Terriglobales bacterium]
MFLTSKAAKLFVLIATGFILLCVAPSAKAQATLLLEEPYSYDGEFAGTGHTAVYLSRVCADSPTKLRRCEPGERGVVISRYHNVAGHDWLAIPLIPYLYAVENAGDIPLYADAKVVNLLRKQYLEKIGISDPEAYQLAGSAYNRTSYAFQIDTTPEQDDKLIELLNSQNNDEAYALLNRNCADFVKQMVNFYYPHAIHRSVIADLGVMTPKQAGKTLVHSGKHHPEMHLTTFIIPQVPGLKRSKPIHGVIESLVLAKKYVTPVLMFHPFVVGSVEAAYWAGWRFDPGKGALIFDPVDGLERPLTKEQRAWHEKALAAMKKENAQPDLMPNWHKFEGQTQPQVDADGAPFLEARTDDHEETMQVGICRRNALRMVAQPELVQGLLYARLEQELKGGKPARASEQQIEKDWKLLQQATKASEASLTTSSSGTD